MILIASGSGSDTARPLKALPKSPATAGTRWVAGTARASLNSVNAGVIASSNASATGNVGAATAAGTRLATVATTALHGAMPPVQAGVYRAALRDLVRAGHAAAAGKLTAAAPLVADGIAGLPKVTVSADAPTIK